MAQPAGTHPVTLDSGDVLYVPDRYGEEETERLRNEYNRVDAANASNVVPSGDDGAGTGNLAYPEPDPSKSDSYLTAAGKHIGAAVQGTGRGFAGLGDLALSGVNAAGEFISNPVRQLRGEEPLSTGFVHPLTTLYDENLPAAPEGYENTAGWAEMLGPIAATEVVSGGLATPGVLAGMRGASFLPKAAKVAETALVKPLLKTPVIATTGIVGGEVGGGLGKLVGGGPNAEALGALIGSTVAPAGAMTAVKNVAKAATMDPRSGLKLQAIKDLNKNLPPEKQITPTLGSVGNKPTALMEDVTARKYIGGQPAFAARQSLYEGLEQTVVDASAAMRGRSTGTSVPASGQITKETLGQGTAGMAEKAIEKARKKISDIENALEATIGTSTPVDPTPFYTTMNNIIKNPLDHDASVVAHAKAMVDKLEKNMPIQRDPTTGDPIIGANGEVVRADPTYGATRENRQEVRKDIQKREKSKGGGGAKLGAAKQGYGGLTEALSDTAKTKGVVDFKDKQQEVADLYADIGKMEPATTAKTEAAAADALFSGRDKASLDQFDPYQRHVPESLAPLMADALELRLREGSAGLPVNPRKFDPENLETHWSGAGEDYRRAYSGEPSPNAADIRKSLDDAALMAEAERVRPGQRTRPGGSGSTIGALAIPGLGTAAGAIHGYMEGGGGLGGLLSGAAYATAGGALGEAGTYGLGRLMTDPRVVDAIANPVNPIGRAFRRALQGAAAEGGFHSRSDKSDMQRQLEEEQGRQYMQ